MPYQLGPGFAQIGALYGSPLGGKLTAELVIIMRTLMFSPTIWIQIMDSNLLT